MSDSLTPSSDSYRYNPSPIPWNYARSGSGGTSLNSSATTLKIGVYSEAFAYTFQHQLYRAYLTFPLSDIIPSVLTDDEIASIRVISCTLTLRGISGSGNIAFVSDNGGWTQYGTVRYIYPFNISAGENIGTFNANGINYIQSLLRSESATVSFRLLQNSYDFSNVAPTSAADRTFTIASVDHGTAGYRPTLTITWEVAGVEHTGTGGGVCGGTASIGAISAASSSGASAGGSGSAGIVIGGGSQVTTDCIALITNVATISDVVATTEDANHPARNLKYPDKPFKTYRQGQNASTTWLTFYLDRLCDTIILYNFTMTGGIIKLNAPLIDGLSWDIATLIKTDPDTGIKSACFRYSESFSIFHLWIDLGATPEYGYELGSVLAGTRTELTTYPGNPLTKQVEEYVHDIEYDAGNAGIWRIGRNNHRLAYDFPVMTRDNFDAIKSCALHMSDQGLCGIYEKRSAYEVSYIAYPDGEFQYTDEEYQNMRASMNFRGVS